MNLLIFMILIINQNLFCFTFIRASFIYLRFFFIFYTLTFKIIKIHKIITLITHTVLLLILLFLNCFVLWRLSLKITTLNRILRNCVDLFSIAVHLWNLYFFFIIFCSLGIHFWNFNILVKYFTILCLIYFFNINF